MTRLFPIFAYMSLRMLEFLTYLCSGVVCLVLGIVLLSVRTDYIDGEKEFRRVKNFVAVAAFFDVLLDVLIIMMQNWRANYFLADWFFVPVVLWLQLTMGACSVLSVFRSKEINTSTLFLFCVPVAVLTVLHYSIFFIFWSTEAGFIESYRIYLHSSVSYALCGALYSIVLFEVSALGVWLVRDVRKYNRLLSEYCSRHEMKGGKHLNIVLYGYFIYFFISGANLVLHNVITSIVLQLTATCLFIVFVIPLINLQVLFAKVGSIYNLENEEEKPVLPAPVPVPEMSISRPEDSHDENVSGMEAIVEGWVSMRAKPYLRDGLTLAEAAESMGLSQRLLSDYLNNTLGKNFNSWLNGLRVEEVKRILKVEKNTPLQNIAARTGFLDASSMSKIFKRFTGMPPSAFRKAETAE